MAHILVVEDDPTVREVVVSYLQHDKHTAHTLIDGGEADDFLNSAEASGVDLVLLDVMLPTIDGIEVCRRLRQARRELPVVMLSALGQEEDRIVGLQIGADDYVTKPFSPRELMLRINSVLRRANAQTEPTPVLTFGPLRLDTSARSASRDGIDLNLTVRELDLLAFLISRPGVAFTRVELMAAVWGWTFGDHSTVTVHVRRIREKVESDPRDPQLIQTVWGVGYRMGPPR
jgi:DNA-binding response OmpR family regulator